MNVPSMCTGSPRKSGTCCEPSGGLGARNPLGQPLGPPGAHFLDCERVQRHFSATRKANTKIVNTGDLEVVTTLSPTHRAQGRHPSSFNLHPSSVILHPSSFILHPSSCILHPSSFNLASSPRAASSSDPYRCCSPLRK